MSKRRISKLYKRAMAILLTAAMVFSTFQGMSLSAYAAETADVTEQQMEGVQDGEAGGSLADEDIQEGTGEGEDTKATSEETGQGEETPGEGEESGGAGEETGTEEGEESGDAGEETGTEEGEEPGDAGEETGVEEGEESGDAGEEIGTEEGEESEELEETELTEELEDGPSIEEVPAEGETASLAYTGEEYDNGNGLGIYFNGMANAGMEFTDANLIAILNARATDEEGKPKTYQYIQINYPTMANKVSKDVWNAVVNLAADDSYFYVNFNGMAEATPTADEMWSIKNPTTASGDISLDANWSLNKTDGTMTMSFSNGNIPGASWNWVVTAWKSNVETVYTSMMTIFGEGGSLVIKDADENEVDTLTTSMSVSDSLVELSFYYINELTTGASYTVSTQVYEGDVSNEGKSLSIDHLKMGTFSDDKLLAILNKYTGSAFTYISISYPYTSVPQNIWNAIVALADEGCILYIGSSGSGGAWNFKNPSTASADVELGINLTISDTKVSVSFDNTTVPADSMSWVRLFWPGSDDGSNLLKVFGESGGVFKVIPEDKQYIDNTDVLTYVFPNNGIIQVSIGNVHKLKADATYLMRKRLSLKEDSYIGTVSDDYLRIDASEISKNHEKFNDDYLVDILNYHEVGSYSAIDIVYDKVTDSIDAAVWNAAVALLSGDNPQLSFLFPGGTAPGENWIFTNPTSTTTADDINTALTMTINDAGEGMTVTFNNTTFPADKVTFAPYSSSAKTEHEKLLAAFGDGMSARIKDSSGKKQEGLEASYTHSEDGSARILMDIYAKTADKTYQLTADSPYTVYPVYAGNIWQFETTIGLDILPSDMGKEVFTDAELAAILAENAGTVFDEIYVEYIGETEGNTISGDAINSIIGYLSDSEETDQYAKIAFGDSKTGKHVEWRLLHPSAEEAGSSLSAEADVTVSDGKVLFEVNKASFNAERVDIWFTYPKGNADYTSIMSVLGNESIPLLIGEVEGAGYYEVGDNYISIRIDGASDLTTGTEYELCEDRYLGTVEGEEGSQRLFLDYRDLLERGQEYSDALFIETMEAHKGSEFVAVHVTVPAGEEDWKNRVDKEVYNAALGLLQDENREGVYYNFNHEEKNVLWFLSGGNAISKDLTFTYEVGRDSYGAVRADFDLPAAADLKNASVSLAIEYSKGSWEAEDLQDALGEGTADGLENVIYRLYPTGDCEIPVKWVDMDESLKLGFMYNIAALDESVTYTVASRYPGEINEGEDWRSLYISASSFGWETFEEGVLEEVLSYYLEAVEAEEMEAFNGVCIEQKNADGKNVIRAVDYNLLLPLLYSGNPDEGRNLEFIFCACADDEADNHYTNDIVWGFSDPYTQAEDINANVTVSTLSGQGVKVKVNANSYAVSDGVYVSYRLNEELGLAKKLDEALGQSSQEGKELVALKKGTTLDLTCGGYFMSEDADGETRRYFEIYVVENMVAGTEYLLAPYQVISEEADENSFYIGDDLKNSEKLKNETLYGTQGTADAGSKKWISYNQERMLISADGQVEALNSGEVYYALTYKVGGASKLQVYKNQVDVYLTELLLNKTAVTMTLPREDEDWEATEFLRVKFYPALAAIDQHELSWEIIEQTPVTEGEQVIELITEEYLIYTEDDYGNTVAEYVDGIGGGIKALNPGTAKVLVTVPGREGEEAVSKTCVITVKEPADVPENSWPDACAVVGLDTTLNDVEFTMEAGGVGEWSWAYPDTDLANFKDMDYHAFPAIYTTEDGEKLTRNVDVRMVRLESIKLWEITKADGEGFWFANPVTEASDGEVVVLQPEIVINGGNYEDISEHLVSGRLKMTWTTSSKNTTIVTDSEEWGEDSCVFTADSDKAGKKTFTVTLTDTLTGKKLLSASHSVTVLKKPLADIDEMLCNLEWSCENDKPNQVGEKGTLVIRNLEADYYKLTVKSLDTNILKLGSAKVDKTSEPGCILTKIPYEIKAEGKIYISITAADEVKSSSSSLVRELIDYTPKFTGETLTINKKWTDKVAYFNIQLAENTYIKASEVAIAGEEAADFAIAAVDEEAAEISGVAGIKVTLTDSTVKVTKHKIKIKVPVYLSSDATEPVCNYEETITISVTDKVPSVTFKQSGKVNLFYTDEEGYGTLLVTSGEDVAVQVKLQDKLDKNGAVAETCNYEILPYDETDRAYSIRLKDDVTPDTKNGKKGTLVYSFEGYEGAYTKDITIAVEEKAPGVELSTKSSTIYPNFNNWYTEVSLTNKGTKEPVEICEAYWVKDAKKGDYVEIPEYSSGENITMKSRFAAYYIGGTVCFELREFGFSKAATDKVSLQVRESNWRKPVSVTYSITTEVKAPKLELGSKTLNLNVNQAVYEQQMTRTSLSLAKSDVKIGDVDVRFVGKDAKSRAVLNNNLVLEYWGDSGEIIARFNAKDSDDRPEAGTYKYTVYADINMWGTTKSLSTEIAVKVVDKDVSKCLKLTAKGSLDVLDRAGTCITYTPKLSDLSGEIMDAYLTGKDAELFNCAWNVEKGQLEVWARADAAYSTKNTYKVTPVFWVQTQDWEGYEVSAKEQSIKMKQGKPKVTVSSTSNVLYRDRENELEINFDAVLNKTTDVEISGVRLVNYTSDLDLYEEDQRFILTQYDEKEIVAKGKSWNLKFEVIYRDKAGNEKNTQVTYKVVIK